MHRFVEWDNFEFRVSGEKIAGLVGREIEKMNAPVAQLTLEFGRGLLKIDGRIRKAIGIPFSIEIPHIHAEGHLVQIFLQRASAFGIPLPTFLLGLIRERLAEKEVEYDAATRSFRVRLDRFLPPFIDVNLTDVQLIEGGIAVRLGAGGADLPPTSAGNGGVADGRVERPVGS